MELFIQQGYGMMGLNREFAEKYDNMSFILSPRSLQVGQDIKRIEEHAEELRDRGAKILFDPQFYLPRTNIEKILNFPYFEGLDYATTDFLGDEAKRFSENAVKYQKRVLNTSSVIIPGAYTNSYSQDWSKLHDDLIEGALFSGIDGEFYQTLSMGPDLVLSDEFDDLIGTLVLSEADGFYVTLKKPSDDFMVTDDTYLYKLLDAFLSIKLAGKKIILGYSNQQDIMFSSVGVDAIASGNYQNVRFFNPDIFFDNGEENIKRKGSWYYDNKTLSEFKPQQMSLAQRRGFFEMFGPINEYNRSLLEANPVTGVPWPEGKNFRNYLYWMNENCGKMFSYGENKVDSVMNFFEEKEANMSALLDKGFRVGNRGFSLDAFESTLSAISAIKQDRTEDLKYLEEI